VNGPTPQFYDVLARVVPGRVVSLALTREQKSALRDPAGQLARNVLQHLLGARAAALHGGAPDRFPLTEQAFKAVARKLGYAIGDKRCRQLVSRLVAARVVVASGSYRQAYRRLGTPGYHVALYRLACCVAPLRRKRPVGNGQSVKGRFAPRWWQHPLFGDASGRPPPGLSHRHATGMQSLDERETPWRYGLAFARPPANERQ
jgi:hypothetical protein